MFKSSSTTGGETNMYQKTEKKKLNVEQFEAAGADDLALKGAFTW